MDQLPINLVLHLPEILEKMPVINWHTDDLEGNTSSELGSSVDIGTPSVRQEEVVYAAQAEHWKSQVQALEQALLARDEQSHLLRQQIAWLEEQLIEAMQLPAPAQSPSSSADLQQALRFAHSLRDAHVNPRARLKAVFPSFFIEQFPAPDQTSHLISVTERFGLVYVVFVLTPVSGLLYDVFSLITHNVLQSLISTRKYVSPSRLIEEFFNFLRASPDLPAFVDGQDYEMAVCLLDTANGEAEFSSTGCVLFHQQGGHLVVYPGGPAPEGHAGTFLHTRLSLIPGTRLLFSSLPPETVLPGGLRMRELFQQLDPALPSEAMRGLLTPYFQQFPYDLAKGQQVLLAGFGC